MLAKYQTPLKSNRNNNEDKFSRTGTPLKRGIFKFDTSEIDKSNFNSFVVPNTPLDTDLAREESKHSDSTSVSI